MQSALAEYRESLVTQCVCMQMLLPTPHDQWHCLSRRIHCHVYTLKEGFKGARRFCTLQNILARTGVHICSVCVCVCVCEREREREVLALVSNLYENQQAVITCTQWETKPINLAVRVFQGNPY